MTKLSAWKTAGVIFVLSAAAVVARAQTLTTLTNFDNTDGAIPWGSLAQGADGKFYGTTIDGGIIACDDDFVGCGTAFTITPDGTLTSLHSFDTTDGNYPSAGLVLATDGNFYGTTSQGGYGSFGGALYSGLHPRAN